MNQSPPKKPEDTVRSRTTPELSLVEDPPPRDLAIEDAQAQPHGFAPATGYNPYDTGRTIKSRVVKPPGAAAEPAQPRKPTDLRKLSEWIKAQRRAEAAKAEAPDGEAATKSDAPAASGVTTPRR